MALQYLDHASSGAFWCGVQFAIRALFEIIAAILWAPFAIVLGALGIIRLYEIPSVRHSGKMCRQAVTYRKQGKKRLEHDA